VPHYTEAMGPDDDDGVAPMTREAYLDFAYLGDVPAETQRRAGGRSAAAVSQGHAMSTPFYAPQSEDADPEEDLSMTAEQIKRATANVGKLMARTRRRREARERYEAKEQRRAGLCRMLNNFEHARRTGGELNLALARMDLEAAAARAAGDVPAITAMAPGPAPRDDAGGAGGYCPWGDMREDDNDDIEPMTREEFRAAVAKSYDDMLARGLIKPKPQSD
jgi:hypothetical protein